MSERSELRKDQVRKVMPLIGSLLDAWEAVPNDLRGDPDLTDLARCLRRINRAIEGHSDNSTEGPTNVR